MGGSGSNRAEEQNQPSFLERDTTDIFGGNSSSSNTQHHNKRKSSPSPGKQKKELEGMEVTP